MTVSTRWTLALIGVVGALIVAFGLQLRDDPLPAGSAGAPASRTHRDADTPEALADLRRRADLPPCPSGDGAIGPPPLRGIVVECAADGSPVQVGSALADRVVVLNLWAYWCGPCAEELPAMADYQRRMGDRVSVVTVHQDENEAAALQRMAELGVRLPVLQDGRRSIAGALRLPNVMPATVVLRRDGSVAKVLPEAFTSVDTLATAVEAALR